MMYKVYVLYSPSHDKLFTGLTTGLIDRMQVHNSDSPDEWTTVYRPWTLVHMELFSKKDDALMRETFLDGEGGHHYIREAVLPLFRF